MFAPTRGLSQLTTAFLAEQLQGIRRRPLPACHITHLPLPVSDAARKRPRQIGCGLGGARAQSPRTDFKDPSSQRRERNATQRLHHLSTIRPAASRRLAGDPLQVASPESEQSDLATVEVWGLEPQTYGLQSHRSSHLSYTPGDRIGGRRVEPPRTQKGCATRATSSLDAKPERFCDNEREREERGRVQAGNPPACRNRPSETGADRVLLKRR